MNTKQTARTLSGKEIAVEPPTPYQSAILAGLQSMRVYQGTVSWADKQRRRAKNRVARKSRRANRGTR